MIDRLTTPREPAFRAAVELTSALGRAAAGRFQVEGEKLVRQALAAGRLVESFVLEDRPELAEELAAHGPVRLLPAALLPRLIGTTYATALEAVGIVTRELLPQLPVEGLLLLGEAVQDPRNVGVLIRTAEAAGCAAIAFTDDSADPFSRAAVRSTTGSILRQPLALLADLPETLAGLRAAGVKVIATSARATTAVWDVDLTGPLALLVGNETGGLSDATRAAADALVALPCAGASSLNVTVAAGALLYEARRQRRG